MSVPEASCPVEPPWGQGAGSAAWEALAAKASGVDPRSLARHSRDGLRIGPLYAAAAAPPPVLWRAPSPIGILGRVDHPDPEHARIIAEAELRGGATGLVAVIAGAGTSRGFGLASVGHLCAALPGLDGGEAVLRLEPPPFLDEAVCAGLADGLFAGRAGATWRVDWSLDPLGDMARCGGAPCRWPELARRTGATARRILDHAVSGLALGIDGRPHHEAGASEAQELAALLATGAAYLRLLEAAGLDLATARRTLGFTLVADADPVMTVAKFRALRQLWACLEAACGLAPEPLRLHAETAWRMMTRHDAWTNLIRTTVAATGAILGGADSLAVLPFTAVLGLADAMARRAARNTSLVLIEEAGLAHVQDPAAGSGAHEAITAALRERAWALFQDIERQGGMAAVLETGWWQAGIQESRGAAHPAPPIVGTTVFQNSEASVPSGLPLALVAFVAPAWEGLHFEPLPSLRDAAPFEGQEAA